MSLAESLIRELERESKATRAVLERVPDDQLSWKPHPKSMSLGCLAFHVAAVPARVAEVGAVDTFH
ncbi:MAG: DinB family protein, partial [Acidobacteria bacterium]|nr:DinB family protein [Acidobacteriota bacterium]